MTHYREVSSDVLDYRDDRDTARVQVRNLMRRITNKVDAHISMEHAQAQLEGREITLDMSKEGLQRLIVQVAVKEFGGGTTAAIGG